MSTLCLANRPSRPSAWGQGWPVWHRGTGEGREKGSGWHGRTPTMTRGAQRPVAGMCCFLAPGHLHQATERGLQFQLGQGQLAEGKGQMRRGRAHHPLAAHVWPPPRGLGLLVGPHSDSPPEKASTALDFTVSHLNEEPPYDEPSQPLLPQGNLCSVRPLNLGSAARPSLGSSLTVLSGRRPSVLPSVSGVCCSSAHVAPGSWLPGVGPSAALNNAFPGSVGCQPHLLSSFSHQPVGRGASQRTHLDHCKVAVSSDRLGGLVSSCVLTAHSWQGLLCHLRGL